MTNTGPSIASLVLLAAATLAACGSGSDSSGPSADLSVNLLSAQSESVSHVSAADELADYLPNRLFDVGGREPAPLAAGLVIGEVTNAQVVTAGQVAPLTKDGDAPYDKIVDADARGADWRHIAVTVTVSEGWGPAAASPEVTFILNIGGSVDDESFIESVKSWGVIVVAVSQSPDGTSTYRTPAGGTAIAFVDAHGSLSMPIMDTTASQGFLGTTSTVDGLRAAAREKESVEKLGHTLR